MRVRNIFICSGVVFCASSRMTNESLSVRPRMNASGAISIDAALEELRDACRSPSGRTARRTAGAGTDRPSAPGRRAGSRAARRPRPPGARARCACTASRSQRVDRAGDREIGLAGAGRPDAEGEVVGVECWRDIAAGWGRARGWCRAPRAPHSVTRFVDAERTRHATRVAQRQVHALRATFPRAGWTANSSRTRSSAACARWPAMRKSSRDVSRPHRHAVSR